MVGENGLLHCKSTNVIHFDLVITTASHYTIVCSPLHSTNSTDALDCSNRINCFYSSLLTLQRSLNCLFITLPVVWISVPQVNVSTMHRGRSYLLQSHWVLRETRNSLWLLEYGLFAISNDSVVIALSSNLSKLETCIWRLGRSN